MTDQPVPDASALLASLAESLGTLSDGIESAAVQFDLLARGVPITPAQAQTSASGLRACTRALVAFVPTLEALGSLIEVQGHGR